MRTGGSEQEVETFFSWLEKLKLINKKLVEALAMASTSFSSELAFAIRRSTAFKRLIYTRRCVSEGHPL